MEKREYEKNKKPPLKLINTEALPFTPVRKRDPLKPFIHICHYLQELTDKVEKDVNSLTNNTDSKDK